MSRRVRLIYFIAAVLVFLIIAPLLLLYSAGWRYNFSHRNVEKVGGIIIETEPRGAIVSINGQTSAKKTPCTIDDLLPGQYTITLKKDNYYPWVKPATVKTGITNRLTGIILLKEPVSMAPLLPDTLSHVLISDGAQYAASYDTGKPLTIINIPTAQIIYQNTDESDITEWQWSPAGSQAIFKNKNNQYFLLTISAATTVQDLATLFKMQFDTAIWSQDENDIVYARAEDNFYRLNTFQKTATLVNDDSHTVFSAGTLLFNELPDQLDITTATAEIKNQIPLLAGYHLRYIGPSNDLLMILDENHQFLYVYNMKNNTFEKSAESVTGVDWDKKTNQVLFYNNLELWTWNLQANQKTLILRTSDTISRALWLKNNAYILTLNQSGNLKIIESVSTDRNTYELPISGVSSIYTDTSSNTVILLANQKLYAIKL